jgi:hypothetical protein
MPLQADEWNAASLRKIGALIEAGVTLRSPSMTLQMGMAILSGSLADGGYQKAGAENRCAAVLRIFTAGVCN